MADPPPFRIDFYEDENGRKPALNWILKELTVSQRRTVGLAMNEILQHQGIEVCEGEWGKALGSGLYEFRIRRGASEIFASSTSPRAVRRRAAGLLARVKPSKERILLRVFFHPDGEELIILLSGYDKGRFPSKKRQNAEIATARRYLEDWLRQQQKKQSP
jgi:phage-related protein